MAMALWAMARENLDITTIVINNDSYAILNIELLRVGVQNTGPKALSMLDLSNPSLNWTQISEGMGVPAVRAKTAWEHHSRLDGGTTCKKIIRRPRRSRRY